MSNNCTPIEIKRDGYTLKISPQSKKGKIYHNCLEGNYIWNSDAGVFDRTPMAEYCEEEAEYQLIEGCRYDYQFEPNNYQFSDIALEDVIRYSGLHSGAGTINTGLNVGTLELDVIDTKNSDKNVSKFSFEIQSCKFGYRKDYQIMLQDIVREYAELVMLQGAPAKQRMEIDQNTDALTLYQQFSFMRSFVESIEFDEALAKIESNPVRRWTDSTRECPITNLKRINRSTMRQIYSSKNRVQADIPGLNDLRNANGVLTLPRTIPTSYKCDSLNIPENQFVKFVLQYFIGFCEELRSQKNAGDRLKKEIDSAVRHIEQALHTNFFRQISMPTHLNLNSPVLQRKEGYREMLQTWIFFDLSGKLAWKGGESVYSAGKRNVAALYEYWVFFQLLRVVEDAFSSEDTHVKKNSLVEMDGDRINLRLSEGNQVMIDGNTNCFGRLLNFQLFYNRTFSVQKDRLISKAGSWSVPMRPDYTLSVWPGEISAKEAEEEDCIVHVHFDAKYRVNQFFNGEQTGSNDNGLDTEFKALKETDVMSDTGAPDFETLKYLDDIKEQEVKGNYKRADILKMHAYKDAIRRTGGAYVIYPGDVPLEPVRGFHEIIPGLGAFCLKPSKTDDGCMELSAFLKELIAHFTQGIADICTRSQRERIAQYQHDVIKPYSPDQSPDFPNILFGYSWSKEHFKWIDEHKLYNFRGGNREGALQLTNEALSAKYLVVYQKPDENGCIDVQYYKLDNKQPLEVCSRLGILARGYPDSEIKDVNYIYYLFHIERVVDSRDSIDMDGINEHILRRCSEMDKGVNPSIIRVGF